jgi:hypothetical protein
MFALWRHLTTTTRMLSKSSFLFRIVFPHENTGRKTIALRSIYSFILMSSTLWHLYAIKWHTLASSFLKWCITFWGMLLRVIGTNYQTKENRQSILVLVAQMTPWCRHSIGIYQIGEWNGRHSIAPEGDVHPPVLMITMHTKMLLQWNNMVLKPSQDR